MQGSVLSPLLFTIALNSRLKVTAGRAYAAASDGSEVPRPWDGRMQPLPTQIAREANADVVTPTLTRTERSSLNCGVCSILRKSFDLRSYSRFVMPFFAPGV